jgi:hypothetical protein
MMSLHNGFLGRTLVPGRTDEFDTTRQIGGVENMKDRSSIFRTALAAMTTTAVCLVAFGGVASAQNTAAPNGPPAATASQAPAMTYGVGEVVKMYQGGINKDIIVNFINSTSLPYRLNADGIIYLQTLGMPPEITKALLQREGQIQQQQQANPQYYQPQQPQQPMPGGMPPPYGYGAMPDQQPIQVMTPSTPAPEVTVIGSDYGDYGYGGYNYPYPYYGYGYGWPYYYPPIIGGLGWGRVGYGGFRGGVGGFRGGVGVGGFRGGVGVGGFRAGGGIAGGFHAGGGGGGGRAAVGGGGHGGGGGHR